VPGTKEGALKVHGDASMIAHYDKLENASTILALIGHAVEESILGFPQNYRNAINTADAVFEHAIGKLVLRVKRITIEVQFIEHQGQGLNFFPDSLVVPTMRVKPRKSKKKGDLTRLGVEFEEREDTPEPASKARQKLSSGTETERTCVCVYVCV
jgi:hypothetical protein